MCLDTVAFNLEKNKDGEIVGIGYKAIHNCDVNYPLPYGLWKEAELDESKLPRLDSGNNNLITSEQGLKYTVGFHIFLTMKDACDYVPYYTKENWDIYEVEFTNVTGFGQNLTYGIDKELRPCIIAQHIRYLRKVYKCVY